MVSMAEPAVPAKQVPAKPKVKDRKSGGAPSGAASAKGRYVVEPRPSALEVEMAREDLYKVAHPDIHRPFSSLEDAFERLLPYHVLAEYELEAVYMKGGSELLSRNPALEETLRKKTEEFMSTMDRQVKLYNTIMRKQREGEMRGEERMMLEQSLLMEEKQKLSTVRAQIEENEKAEQEAAEAKARVASAQAERAQVLQAEAEAKAEAFRAEADSLAPAESLARLEGKFSASPSEHVNMLEVSSNRIGDSWVQVEGEEDILEDDMEDDDLEGVWDEEGDEAMDEDDVAETLGDYDNGPSEDRFPKPS